MKKTFLPIVFILVLLTLFSACKSEGQTNSSQSPKNDEYEKISAMTQQAAEEYLLNEYVHVFNNAYLIGESWQAQNLSPQDINSLYVFNVIAFNTEELVAQYEVDDSTYPARIYIPAQVVESYVSRYIDVSSEYLRKADNYDNKKDSYLFETDLKLFGNFFEVLNYSISETELIIEFEKEYVTFDDMATSSFEKRNFILTFKYTSGYYKAVSCELKD